MLPDCWQHSRIGENCMIKNTLITMADGTQKPIQDVEIGDIILGYDFEAGQPTPAVVM
jgi:hypothetical protein